MVLDNFKNFWGIERRTKYFTYVLTYFFIFSIVIFGLLIIGEKSLNEKARVITEAPNAFEEVKLEAKSAVVWDVVGRRELFSKNAELPLPLASLTKVMTALVTNKKLDGNQEVKITKEDLSPEGDSDLAVGDIWRVRDLRDFTLFTSSNDGAFALAAVAEAKDSSAYNLPGNVKNLRNQFVKEMNDTATAIGLSNSIFFNEHGLDMPVQIAGSTESGKESAAGGAYGSAKDMAILFEYTLKNYPEILEATRYKNLEFESNEKRYSVENTNTIVDKIPNLIASKTGYTDLAGGNLVVAFDAGLNRPIIISVLGSTEEGRFSDVLQLVGATLKQLPSL